MVRLPPRHGTLKPGLCGWEVPASVRLLLGASLYGLGIPTAVSGRPQLIPTHPADSTEAPKPKSSPDPPAGSGRIRTGTQVRVLGSEDDLAGLLLQVLPFSTPSTQRLLPAPANRLCASVSSSMGVGQYTRRCWSAQGAGGLAV